MQVYTLDMNVRDTWLDNVSVLRLYRNNITVKNGLELGIWRNAYMALTWDIRGTCIENDIIMQL